MVFDLWAAPLMVFTLKIDHRCKVAFFCPSWDHEKTLAPPPGVNHVLDVRNSTLQSFFAIQYALTGGQTVRRQKKLKKHEKRKTNAIKIEVSRILTPLELPLRVLKSSPP